MNPIKQGGMKACSLLRIVVWLIQGHCMQESTPESLDNFQTGLKEMQCNN